MKIKSFSYLVILFVFFFTLPGTTPARAAKPRVRTAAVAKSKAITSSVSYSSVRLSRATNSVVVSFKNLRNVSTISYTLSYNSNGIQQGVVGSVSPSGSTDSRDLYFGTCSHGVCTPHYRIKNAALTIVTKLKSGARSSKRYLIKV